MNIFKLLTGVLSLARNWSSATDHQDKVLVAVLVRASLVAPRKPHMRPAEATPPPAPTLTTTMKSQWRSAARSAESQSTRRSNSSHMYQVGPICVVKYLFIVVDFFWHNTIVGKLFLWESYALRGSSALTALLSQLEKKIAKDF